MKSFRKPRVNASQGGFSLIEVLIALLVLSIGLLGLAMLQTMNVRFTQGANYRTQATNLASIVLEQARADHANAGKYATSYKAATDTDSCASAAGGVDSKFKTVFQCQLASAFGDDATASVTYVDNFMTVEIDWGDADWLSASGNKKFSMTTRL